MLRCSTIRPCAPLEVGAALHKKLMFINHLWIDLKKFENTLAFYAA